tara:strand:- start:281 stop:877 length:597 start_codon:yes stop_codon:yes gene_type:complete
MSVTINGNGTITGYDPVPNGSITTAKLANNAVDHTKTTGLQRRIQTGPNALPSASSFTHTVTTGVKKIEIWIQDASAGDSDMRIQLTDSSLQTSGYGYSAGFIRSNGTGGAVSRTTGFRTYGFDSDSYNISGCWTLRNPHGNTWIAQHQFWGSAADDHDFYGVGRKTLSGTLTSFTLNCDSGSFDNGNYTIIETMGDD